MGSDGILCSTLWKTGIWFDSGVEYLKNIASFFSSLKLDTHSGNGWMRGGKNKILKIKTFAASQHSENCDTFMVTVF